MKIVLGTVLGMTLELVGEGDELWFVVQEPGRRTRFRVSAPDLIHQINLLTDGDKLWTR